MYKIVKDFVMQYRTNLFISNYLTCPPQCTYCTLKLTWYGDFTRFTKSDLMFNRRYACVKNNRALKFHAWYRPRGRQMKRVRDVIHIPKEMFTCQ